MSFVRHRVNLIKDYFYFIEKNQIKVEEEIITIHKCLILVIDI